MQDPEDDSTQDDCHIVVASEQTTTHPAQVSECAALVTPGPERALGDVHVSAIERVEDAVLSFSIENDVPPLARRAWHARGLGDFWAHMLVAEGAVDGAVDNPGVSEWDLAAVQVIVEEAGGRFSDVHGVSRIDGGTAVSSNGLLHDELLAALSAA